MLHPYRALHHSGNSKNHLFLQVQTLHMHLRRRILHLPVLIIFIAVEMYLMILIFIRVNICFLLRIRIYKLLFYARLKAHIIEQTHRIRLIYSHASIALNFQYLSGIRLAGILTVTRSPCLHLVFTGCLFYHNLNIFQIAFRIYMVGMRNRL